MQNLCFLSCQGLAFRGCDSGLDSNFTQLLQLKSLVDHKDVLGLYKVDAIDVGSLVNTIDDVVIKRAALSQSQCGCYEGAFNMSGSRNGVTKLKKSCSTNTLLWVCTQSCNK